MCGTSLLESVVSITDHSSDLPCAVIVLPDMHEFCFAGCHVILSCLLLVKPMGAYLDCAIARNRVHLKRSWNEASAHFAADIVLGTLD